MSETYHGIKAYQFLFDAMCKRAWGESLDFCDPGDLLDQLRPAFGEAIGAIDDRSEAVGTLLELHEKLGSSGPEAISTLFHASVWTGSTSALADACEKAAEQAGVAVVELLLAGLADAADEEGAAELVFDNLPIGSPWRCGVRPEVGGAPDLLRRGTQHDGPRGGR